MPDATTECIGIGISANAALQKQGTDHWQPAAAIAGSALVCGLHQSIYGAIKCKQTAEWLS